MSKFKNKTYVITSAQAMGDYDSKRGNLKGAPNIDLLSGLKKYCEINGAELKILTMKGKDAGESKMHPEFEGRSDVYFPDNRSQRLNKNLSISNMVVPPQNVDPATGRERFVQNDTTLVYAHSKQRFKTIAASNNKLPKILATTGAVTYPNYNETNHRGDVASRDHTYGAIVIEVINDSHYNLRHMRSQQDGKFVDMSQKFDGLKKPIPIFTEALVLGDIHWGDQEEKTIKANYEMIDFFKPKRLFLHDFVNGHSVNPHERKNLITRAREYKLGRLSLEQELKLAYTELCRLSKVMGKREINLVSSNHGFFLDRYLETANYTDEPWNLELALKIGGKMVEGEDPIEAGIKMMGKVPGNVNFLKLRDDYKVWGWQLGSHGNKGLSGARGSVRSRELAFGKSITAHTHSPEILRNTIIVGTSTKLELPYTEGGANSWLAANAVLYQGGLVQLIPIIGGKWKKK